jgi:dTDP-4-dehydrorhamnose reductase
MKLLITGCNGQLGNELKVLAKDYIQHQFTFTDIEELDISNFDTLEKYIKKNIPDCIINCAAYTAVDKAEGEKEKAFLINSVAAKNLAELSTKFNALLVHISSDYIFDGKSSKPYVETDSSNPKSLYGKTKLNGEVEIVFNAKKAIIIRTSWLYSSFGINFVKTILEKGKEKGELNVVSDQIGTPTYARDLAKTILEIIPDYHPKNNTEIYHFSNEGATSWYDFAKEILELANIKCKVNPVETKDYPTAAQRPQYSLLNKTKIKKEFNIQIPYWKDSLKECIQKIIQKNG